MTTKPRVLVTTPNGRTGSAAVDELLRRRFPVRALVRKDDARAAALRAKGAEVIVGSLHDLRDLQRALAGVQRAYHCPPFDSNHLHGAMLFALAAEEARLEVVALMSGWNPHPLHPSVMQREHWIANNIYRRMSVDVIHINPGLFAFAHLVGLPMAAHFGVLAGTWGDGRNAPPSNEDIGAVAAGALADPSPYIGQCLRPTGPELLSPTDIAASLGRALGRPVVYREVSPSLIARSALALGVPKFQVAQVRHYMKELRMGAFAQAPTDHVRQVTGRDAEDFDSIARRYVAEPHRIMPGLKIGSRAGAVVLALKAMFTRSPDFEAWEASRDYPTIPNGMLAHENPEWVEAADESRLLLQPEPRAFALTN